MVQRCYRLLVVRQVTGYAGNPCEFRVIERRPRPAIDVVAGRAICRELRSYVIRRLGLLELLRMAGIAIRREAFELSGRRSLMTGVAIHHRVGSNQREAVLVILNRADIRFPALHRVARLAVCAHLSAMNICMAIRALRSNIRENWFRMALRAGHVRMHAAQRILCLIVIEFGDRADRLPSSLRVTVLTGHSQGTVRTPRAIARCASPSGRSGHHGRQPQKQDTQDDPKCSLHVSPLKSDCTDKSFTN